MTVSLTAMGMANASQVTATVSPVSLVLIVHEVCLLSYTNFKKDVPGIENALCNLEDWEMFWDTGTYPLLTRQDGVQQGKVGTGLSQSQDCPVRFATALNNNTRWAPF